MINNTGGGGEDYTGGPQVHWKRFVAPEPEWNPHHPETVVPSNRKPRSPWTGAHT